MKFSSLVLSSLPFVSVAHPGRGNNGEPCPFLSQDKETVVLRRLGERKEPAERKLEDFVGDGGIPEGGYAAVKEDLKVVMTDSQDFWPADFAETHGPHYGGLFIRLAWHCSGTYRQSDGRGGCDGGRIRFEPEAKWMDNGNLDKAIELLKPIKEKYGDKLSWGDLIVLSGSVAIEFMGGKTLGFCGGRIDDNSGAESEFLGPSDEQEAIAPCESIGKNGDCLSVDGTALGPTTLGLIYVNPAGPDGFKGNFTASGADIRRAFGRMGFNDTESVSLIGGGHAFGKAHGACGTPPCPDGGVKTSGFEGSWTTTPTTWSNEFFRNMFDFEWIETQSPAGNLQWAPQNGTDVFMLTTDLALSIDEGYKPISELYRDDIGVLEADFAASWYRLTTQDMGPVQRCLGDDIPPPQSWQNTLPDSPTDLPDYVPIRKAIQSIIDEDDANSDAMINLAYRCASTYRATDHRGGCNGAKIRLSPEKDWATNVGTADALAKLESVKAGFPSASYADLIILAGITALEKETEGLSIPFCGGYVDTDSAAGSEALAPRFYATPLITVRDDFQVKGLTPEEGVALAARENLSSQFFIDLKVGATARAKSFSDSDVVSALLEEEFAAIVDKYASDEEALKLNFVSGWTKLMTGDRYKNYRENACSGVNVFTTESTSAATVWTLGSVVAGVVLAMLI